MAKSSGVTPSRKDEKKLTAPDPDPIGIVADMHDLPLGGLKRPEDPEYEVEKDPLFLGFAHTYNGDYIVKKVGADDLETLSGWFFLTDPETGKRPGEERPPWGGNYTDLSRGFIDSSGKSIHVIPPYLVWKAGMWLWDWLDFAEISDIEDLPHNYKQIARKVWDKKLSEPCPEDLYPLYITTGEGTPGNNIWRLFELPEKVLGHMNPHHPLMWPKEVKAKKPFGSTYTSGSPTWKKSEPEKPKAPSLPVGLRYRCTGCGHWFKQDDLPGHATVCAALEESGVADWAIMCVAECGCRTLDQVSVCKEGFPRPKTDTVEAAEAAAVAEGAAEDKGDAKT